MCSILNLCHHFKRGHQAKRPHPYDCVRQSVKVHRLILGVLMQLHGNFWEDPRGDLWVPAHSGHFLDLDGG